MGNAYYKVFFFREDLSLNEINFVWYRRLSSDLSNIYGTQNCMEYSFEFKKEFLNFCISEFDVFKRRLISILNFNKVTWFDSPEKSKNFTKIDILRIASNSGLKIPPSIISSNIKEINNFISENRTVICKPLGETWNFKDEEEIFVIYTEVINKPLGLDLKIAPSLFQKNIKKKFEIRVFYLDGEAYSMAIFSSNNYKTKDDYRKYDFSKPNRFIPFQLPEKTKLCIQSLMYEIGLSTGSIDLIKSSEDDELYFLEINPVGQFNMVSVPCRYFLEEKIAKKNKKVL